MPSGENNKGKTHVGIPFNSIPTEEARKIQSMGGIAARDSKRRKKLIKETIATILELPVKDKRVKDGLKRIGLTTEDMTQQSLMVLGVMKRAQNGDPYAATFIRDTLGQKEAAKVTVDSTEVSAIKIKFVNKSLSNTKKETDPKIVGEYTPPSNSDES